MYIYYYNIALKSFIMWTYNVPEMGNNFHATTTPLPLPPKKSSSSENAPSESMQGHQTIWHQNIIWFFDQKIRLIE